MSHVRPDTCAMEYADAFRHASGFGVEETKRKRDVLAERIRRAQNLNYSTALMDAALRGYDDWLEFRARHVVVVNGEHFPPGYTEEAARHEQESMPMKSRMQRWSDAKLAKELAFAEGFGPPTTSNEQTWLDALRAENARRGGVKIEITHDEEGNPLPVMPDITHQPIKESDEELDILK